MPIRIVRGPAGGGKSQWIRERMGPSDVLLDYTTLWAAVTDAARDAAGKYPIRRDGDPRLAMVEWLRLAAVRQAAERELDGFATTSDSRPEAVERLQAAGADGPVETIDPGEAVVRARLSDAVTGQLSPECRQAMARWFGTGGGETSTADPTAGPRASASVAAELSRIRGRR